MFINFDKEAMHEWDDITIERYLTVLLNDRLKNKESLWLSEPNIISDVKTGARAVIESYLVNAKITHALAEKYNVSIVRRNGKVMTYIDLSHDGFEIKKYECSGKNTLRCIVKTLIGHLDEQRKA